MTLASLITIDHLRALDFWGRVNVGQPDECWEWTRAISSNGYGVVHVGARITGLGRVVTLSTHRVAYALHAGSVPDAGMVIDHRCYNRRCCNPAHLDLTTQLTNIRRSRKPLPTPTAHPRKDGSIRWQVRYWAGTGPSRRYLGDSFDTLEEAEQFARDVREA